MANFVRPFRGEDTITTITSVDTTTTDVPTTIIAAAEDGWTAVDAAVGAVTEATTTITRYGLLIRLAGTAFLLDSQVMTRGWQCAIHGTELYPLTL